MTKKIGWIAIAVLVVFVLFAMNMRRARMMAGSNLPLAAVSTDGKQIPLAPDVEALTGKLEKNTVAQKSGAMIVALTLNP